MVVGSTPVAVTLIVYSCKVKGVSNDTQKLDSLNVVVPVADEIGWKGGTPSLTGL